MAIKAPSFTERVTPFLLVLVVVMAFGLGVLWQKVESLESGATTTKVAGNPTAPQPTAPPSGKLSEEQIAKIPQLKNTDHVKGAQNPKVYLIEYSDLECPYCKVFHETLNEFMTDYGSEVAWVYRHFPLDSIHPKAKTEAQAVECAAELGGEAKFWELTDKIFEVTPSNNGLNLDKLPDYAEEVGINRAAFETCLDERRYTERVNNDYQEGIQAGITGTPGTFVVTADFSKAWLIPGSLPLESLKQTVDEALES